MPNTFPQPETWPGLTPYPVALERLEATVAEIGAGGPEKLFFCEHDAVLTLGSSAKAADAGVGHNLPTVITNRGGQVTYHGPGQRVIYPVVKLDSRWNHDIRTYMHWLQQRVQAACLALGVATELRTGDHLGLWVGEAKIAAFGVRVRQIHGVRVAFHGAALNVSNSLDIYKHFTPCGLTGSKAGRLIDFVPSLTMAAVDEALTHAFITP